MWSLPQPLIPLWSSGTRFGPAIFFDYVDSTNAPRLAARGCMESISRQRGQTWAWRRRHWLAGASRVPEGTPFVSPALQRWDSRPEGHLARPCARRGRPRRACPERSRKADPGRRNPAGPSAIPAISGPPRRQKQDEGHIAILRCGPLFFSGKWSGALASPQSLSKRLKAEDSRHHDLQHAIPAVRVAAVVVAAGVAVFIAATETLAEIEVVVVLVYVIAAIAVVGVLVGIRILVAGTPPILSVGPPGAEAFLVAVVHGLPENVCTVLVDLVVVAATTVPIDGSGVVIRIMIVIVVPIVPETRLLLAQTLCVVLLRAILRRTPLLLQ